MAHVSNRNFPTEKSTFFPPDQNHPLSPSGDDLLAIFMTLTLAASGALSRLCSALPLCTCLHAWKPYEILALRQVDCYLQKELCEQPRWARARGKLPSLVVMREGEVFEYEDRPKKAYNMVSFMKNLAGIDDSYFEDDDEQVEEDDDGDRDSVQVGRVGTCTTGNGIIILPC